jgi:hypothetical protein
MYGDVFLISFTCDVSFKAADPCILIIIPFVAHVIFMLHVHVIISYPAKEKLTPLICIIKQKPKILSHDVSGARCIEQ